MFECRSYAASSSQAPLAPFSFARREPGRSDVLIEIQYCGVCHSDLNRVRDIWGGSLYPCVPGHEIVGRVEAVGGSASKFKPGDIVGVGVLVDSVPIRLTQTPTICRVRPRLAAHAASSANSR